MSSDFGNDQETKTAFFHKTNDPYSAGLRVPINPRKYRNMDTLMDDLSQRIPGLSHGVRQITTPRGTRQVKSIDELKHLGRYICSDTVKKTKPTSRLNGLRLLTRNKSTDNLAQKSGEVSEEVSPTKKILSRRKSAPNTKTKDPKEQKDQKETSLQSESPSPPKSLIRRRSKSSDKKTKVEKLTRKDSKPKESKKSTSSFGSTMSDKSRSEKSPSVTSNASAKSKLSETSDTASNKQAELPPKVPRKKGPFRKKSETSVKAHENASTSAVPVVAQYSEEKIQATIKIQAAIRGYQVRKKLKTEEEAATKIQAQFRGHLVRNSQRGPRSDADADDNKAEVPELSNLKYEGEMYMIVALELSSNPDVNNMLAHIADEIVNEFLEVKLQGSPSRHLALLKFGERGRAVLVHGFKDLQVSEEIRFQLRRFPLHYDTKSSTIDLFRMCYEMLKEATHPLPPMPNPRDKRRMMKSKTEKTLIILSGSTHPMLSGERAQKLRELEGVSIIVIVPCVRERKHLEALHRVTGDPNNVLNPKPETYTETFHLGASTTVEPL